MRKITLATGVWLAFLIGPLLNSALAWQIERPRHSSDHHYQLPHRIENCSTDGKASVGLGVNSWKYAECDTPEGYDTIRLNVTMTANTRMHITYNYIEGDLYWIPTDPAIDMVLPNVGDDVGFWVDLSPPSGGTFAFRFYGGTDGGVANPSAEYDRVWICTNGFIAFDVSNSTDRYSTSGIGFGFPSMNVPNAVIAAVWTDLLVDGQASIVYGWRWCYGYYGWQFFITWNNVLHKASGKRLTFQTVLAQAPGYYGAYVAWGQSKFRISYWHVEEINTSFAFGIEDQEGLRGLGNLFQGSTLWEFDGHSYWFQQQDYSSNYFITRLTLTFNDTCTQTKFRIDTAPQHLRGFNVQHMGASESDIDKRYSLALKGTKTLMETIGGTIVKIMFIGIELVDILAENLYSNMNYQELKDQFCENPIPSGAYITVPTPYINLLPKGCVVDASMGIYVNWILMDENFMEHSLMVTAALEYYEVTWNGYVIDTPLFVTTSVNLKVVPDSPSYATNNSFDNATQVPEGTYLWLYADRYFDELDLYRVWVPFLKSIYVKIEGFGFPSIDDVNLYLYNATQHLIQKSENGLGQNEIVYGEQWSYPGDWWYVKVHAVVGYGFYNMTISFGPAGGGGPSEPCPTLFVWNGTAYVDYGVINIHNPSGEDVLREVFISKEDLAVANYHGRFMLREGWPGLNFSESVIDQVKLYAIINGNRYLCPLISAIHSTQGNVWLRLILSDNYKTQMLLLETIDLTFLMPYPTSQIQGYIFIIEGCNMLKQ